MAHIGLTGLSLRDGFKVSGFDETPPQPRTLNTALNTAGLLWAIRNMRGGRGGINIGMRPFSLVGLLQFCRLRRKLSELELLRMSSLNSSFVRNL